jgi:hypothetical protein
MPITIYSNLTKSKLLLKRANGIIAHAKEMAPARQFQILLLNAEIKEFQYQIHGGEMIIAVSAL